MRTIEITHYQEGERKLVAVPLQRSDKRAVLYEDDFQDLVARGIPVDRWKFYHNQPSVRFNNRDVSISRLIRRAQPSQRVMTRDGDHCNLRRDNLVVAAGPAKVYGGGTVDKPFRETVQLIHLYNGDKKAA